MSTNADSHTKPTEGEDEVTQDAPVSPFLTAASSDNWTGNANHAARETLHVHRTRPGNLRL
jgi:hypothetical protein